MPVIAFNRAIGPVPMDCVVSERHSSELTITEIPIESGAKITDHAVVTPKRVLLDIATGSAVATYAALMALQESRVPFTLVTGLSVYNNMLISRIDPERDSEFSQVLRGRVELQEIIIVGTAYAQATGGKKPGQPGGAKSTNSAASTQDNAGAGVVDRNSSTVNSGTTGLNPASPSDSSFLNSLIGN